MEGGNLDNGRGKTARWMDQHRPMYDRATRHPFVLSIRDGTVDISAFRRWLVGNYSSFRSNVSRALQMFLLLSKASIVTLASNNILWSSTATLVNCQHYVFFFNEPCQGQDYIFVREFVPFLASVLLKAWKASDDNSDVEVILGGIASLNDELSWFKREASKWDVHLGGIAPQKANLEYCRLLQSVMLPEIDYAVAITAFWAIETVYQDSFSLCLESGSKTPAELVETCKRWGNAHFKEYCCSLQKIADRCLEKAPGDVVRKAEEAFISVLEHEIGFWNMSSGES